MNFNPVEGAALLASLIELDNLEDLYLRFSTFLAPFQDFIDDFNPSAAKKHTKPKNLPPKGEIMPIAQLFHQFLLKSIKILVYILDRKCSNGGDEIKEETSTKLFDIFRLTIHCYLCITPFLTGQKYPTHFHWFQFVRCLEKWNKFNDAQVEAFDFLESLNTFFVSPLFHLKPSNFLLPNPSVIDSTQEVPQLAILFSELMIVLASCAYKSRTMNDDIFTGLLELADQLIPWFCIMEPHKMKEYYYVFLDAFYKCSLFLAKESKSFNDDLVYSFCLKALMLCFKSPHVEHFPQMAYQICSIFEIQWNRMSSLTIGILNMSLEESSSGNLGDIAKCVDRLLTFISMHAKHLHLIWKDAHMIGPKYVKQVSQVLKLCCKSIRKHIKILCLPQFANSKGHQIYGESNDSLKDVIIKAFDICANVIDILHEIGAPKLHKVIVKSISKLSFVEVSFPNLSLLFPLVKQWVKMLCKDYTDVKEGVAPFLRTLLNYECSYLTDYIIGVILEQELLAYGQLEALNPVLCQRMETAVIDVLLRNVLNDRYFKFQRARVLMSKAIILRNYGKQNLSSCIYCIKEAILLMLHITHDSYEERTLRYHQLAFACLTRAQFTQEAKPDSEVIQSDIKDAISLLSKIKFEAHHTLRAQLNPSVKNTIAMLFYTLDLLSLKGCLTFHYDICTLIITMCKFENFSLDICLGLLWSGKRLGNSFCAYHFHPTLFSRISQFLDNKLNSLTFWTNCLKSISYSLPMFVQDFFLSVSILDEGNVQQFEDFYSCKLTIENIKMEVSSILLDVSANIKMLYFTGQICYDIAERLFAGGRLPEALFYAKEALKLRYKVLRKMFSSKVSKESVKSSIETNGENDHLHLDLGSSITKVWRDNSYLDKCIFSPWSILRFSLESFLQVGIFHEAMGDDVHSEKLFLQGKSASILHSLPIFQIAFSCKLGQSYRKKMLWASAKEELNFAEMLFPE